MMYDNPYLTQRLARERTKDIARQAERSRIICEAKGAGATGRANVKVLLRMICNRALTLVSLNRFKSEALTIPDKRVA
jgi:hypothetical protein